MDAFGGTFIGGTSRTRANKNTTDRIVNTSNGINHPPATNNIPPTGGPTVHPDAEANSAMPITRPRLSGDVLSVNIANRQVVLNADPTPCKARAVVIPIKRNERGSCGPSPNPILLAAVRRTDATSTGLRPKWVIMGAAASDPTICAMLYVEKIVATPSRWMPNSGASSGRNLPRYVGHILAICRLS